MATSSALMARPDFFIVGAPKSGTTALHEYISTHPQICVSDPKEPHYFCEDFPNFRWARSEEEYAGFFENARPEHRAVGEASPLYLYSKVAAEKIKAFAPDAKVIVMLRSYVDYLHSYHYHTLYNRDESVERFEEAWALQSERAAGRRLPATCREPALLQYREVGRIGAQLQRLLGVFERERVRIIFLDQFIAAPQRHYEDVLAFLGVENDGRTEFPKVNQAKAYKSGLIANLTQRPPEPLLKVARRIKPLLGLQNTSILTELRALNTEQGSKKPSLEPAFREQLKAEFRDDAQLLSELTGRDMSSWVE